MDYLKQLPLTVKSPKCPLDANDKRPGNLLCDACAHLIAKRGMTDGEERELFFNEGRLRARFVGSYHTSKLLTIAHDQRSWAVDPKAILDNILRAQSRNDIASLLAQAPASGSYQKYAQGYAADIVQFFPGARVQKYTLTGEPARVYNLADYRAKLQRPTL